jgi:L-threonylcarbamoyladenylate synthase
MRADVERAAQLLRDGGLVAFPTETVYGLGADASSSEALRRLYAVKGRPPGHPVIVHIPADARLEDYAVDVPDVARVLAREFWPGPCTLVLRKRADRVAPEATGGRDTVGLRVPDHPLALALLEVFGGGIAAPSANRFGRVSPTTAEHVRADLGADVDFVLDGGPCPVGIESTIVDCTSDPPALLRLGGVPAEAVSRVAGLPLARLTSGEIAAPGTLPAHYAPLARVEIVDRDELAGRARELVRAGEDVGVLALRADLDAIGPAQSERGVAVLPPALDVDDYARVLYARLRAADELALDVLLVVPPPPSSIGPAVIDRIRRAASR